MRNQRLNASQANSTSSNLADLGWAAARIRMWCGELLGRLAVVGREATVKDCGVAVARLQGQSWSPNPTSGSGVNVGTIPVVPSSVSRTLIGGKARCRLMLPGWGGGLVVVAGVTTGQGGRESRPQGEVAPSHSALDHSRREWRFGRRRPLGRPPHLDAKARGDNSMVGKRGAL